MKTPGDRNLYLRIFLTIFVISLFFTETRFQTTNAVSRYLLTRAMVEQQTFKLDNYQQFSNTDAAFRAGHYYSDKPPGSSIMMIPQYFVFGVLLRPIVEHMVPYDQYKETIVFWLVMIFSVPVYSALSMVIMYRLMADNGYKQTVFLTFTVFFGTLVFAYSTIGTGETFLMFNILATFYFLRKSPGTSRTFLLAGIFQALAILAAYYTVLLIIPALLFLRHGNDRHRPNILMFLGPVCLGLIAGAAYNYYVCGTLLKTPYHFWLYPDNPVVRIEYPTVKKIFNMILGYNRGIFFYSPYLLLSIPGIWYMRKIRRGESAYLFSTVLLTLIFFSVNAGWEGGHTAGFRYSAPFLPFLHVGFAHYYSTRPDRFYYLPLLAASFFWNILVGITSPMIYETPHCALIETNLVALFACGPDNVINGVLRHILHTGCNHWLLWSSTCIIVPFLYLIWRSNKTYGITNKTSGH